MELGNDLQLGRRGFVFAACPAPIDRQPQPTGLLNINVMSLRPLREVLFLSPATMPSRVSC